MVLDELVDPYNTDILIHEFVINDHAGSIEDRQLKLDFWLTRVKALFAQASRPPPPILVLCLWGYGAAGENGKFLKERFDTHPMEHMGEVIQQYVELGWDIGMIDVPLTLNATRVKEDVPYLFDDAHHPSCNGVKLIGSMLQHAILQDLASNFCSPPSARLAHPPYNEVIQRNKAPKWQSLWNDLFHPETRVGSIFTWTPRLNNTTALDIGTDISDWQTVKMGKTVDNRADRKKGYHIPACTGTNSSMLTLVLKEPDLTWLGIGCEPLEVRMVLNGQAITVKSDESWTPDVQHFYIAQWINLKDQNISSAQSYALNLCNPKPNVKMALRILVGVMKPSSKGSNDLEVPS
ncbi:MAG: hypothetical protein SGILL_007641 [Bacillariaceae sp.]